RGVKFVKAKLIDADLGADPANQGMVPVRAELPEANFDGADLTRANLTHAVLNAANFTGAIVRARASTTRCSTGPI
ncbi:MAG TPA: pentapeptide repeat-containing protein, partial [Methylocystis sp.]